MTEEDQAPFIRTNVLRMFPTFVWKAEVGPSRRRVIEAAVRGMVASLRQEAPALGPGESWQSTHDLHRRRELLPLAKTIRAAAGKVLDHLKIARAPAEITGCWVNVLAPGAGHKAHTHPNNFLSGVYYVHIEEGADTINFHDPRAQAGTMRPPVTALTTDNADQVVVRVNDGTLILFPAWLEHSVDANQSPRERISVSFNLMFSRFGETIAQPQWSAGTRKTADPR